MTYYVKQMLVTNEYMINFCKHGDLEKFVNKAMLDESNRQKYEDLMNAEEEQNPVLIKYYFK